MTYTQEEKDLLKADERLYLTEEQKQAIDEAQTSDEVEAIVEAAKAALPKEEVVPN